MRESAVPEFASPKGARPARFPSPTELRVLVPSPQAADLLLRFGGRLAKSQIRQDLGTWISHRQHVVASVAVLGNHLARIVAGVESSMTPETTGEVHMAKVVWVRSPRHLHFGENVLAVDRHHGRGRLGNFRLLRIENSRKFILVKLLQAFRNLLCGLALARILRLQ